MAKQKQLDEVRPILTELDQDITGIENFLDTVDSGADKAAAAVASGLETVADVVPQGLDTAIHVTTSGTRKFVGAFRSPKVMFFTVTGLSMLAGAGLGVAGYFALKKKLEKEFEAKFEKELNEALDEMRTFYSRIKKEGAFATPESAAEALGVKEATDAHTSYDTVPAAGEEVSPEQVAALRERMKRGGPVTDDPDVEVTVERNIFRQGAAATDFDLEQEQSKRASNPDVPFVISKEEYFQGEPSYVNTTITWYEGDGILADERDVPVENVDALIGEENLLRFGYGSDDPNIVYVRNTKNQVDFEVVRSTGEYGNEVAGFGGTDVNLGRKDNGG